jgi:hypothetical protein
MRLPTFTSRWMRLLFSLLACPIFGWILWIGRTQAPLSWIANLILAPETFLALALVGVHGNASAFFTVGLTFSAACIVCRDIWTLDSISATQKRV